MSSCAKNISGQVFARFNITSFTFSYLGNSCAWGNNSSLSKAECFDRVAGRPLFILHYNSTASIPKFSTAYNILAEIYGDAEYYKRCEIGDALN
jgi:hypothetical protein